MLEKEPFIVNSMQFKLIYVIILKDSLRHFLGKTSKELRCNEVKFYNYGNGNMEHNVNFDSKILRVNFSVTRSSRMRRKVRVTFPYSVYIEDIYVFDSGNFTLDFYKWTILEKYISKSEFIYV